MVTMDTEQLKAANEYLGTISAKSMDAKQDESLNHIAHTFGCSVCDAHVRENLQLALELARLKKKAKKWKRLYAHSEAELARVRLDYFVVESDGSW